ncbi:hypothetical protein NHX12_029502 [Muraenolepis orangiensis]|uniref:guanylate cyclase n=1 Tax=Muraenolepis orangiensis TaxID=630683 RepID=A0A9Q0I1L5_9TELE|nr:hypothetical protein NHX12_029502 [Muraenolepis orangiensis]
MYGFINTCLKSLVIEKFGEETWDKLSKLAKVQDTFMTYEVYDDAVTLRLVQEACVMLGEDWVKCVKLFGEHFFSFCKQAGYDTMLRTLGGNLAEFIENLDALHCYLALSYQVCVLPCYLNPSPTRCVSSPATSPLSYQVCVLPCYLNPSPTRCVSSPATSPLSYQVCVLPCYLTPLLPGVSSPATSPLSYQVCVVLHRVMEMGCCCITILTGKDSTISYQDFFDSEVTMTILNQSEEDERTGKKEHVVFLVKQEKRRAARAERGQQGPAKDHREVKNPCCAQGTRGHPAVGKEADAPGGGGATGAWSAAWSSGGKLWMEEKAFCNAFPFHIVFDQDYFIIVHPQVTFTIESIKKFINSQMMWMPSLACMLYLCSPKLRSLQELEERGLHLADIAPHDTTRDLILLNQQRLAEMELSNQLERKKEELRILSHHLAVEKKKTETLLYAMLPQHVANQLREGLKVEAGDFEVCTILFSDVVTFTQICSSCQPIQIVHMLNSMYSRFDRLTEIHGVYKVETIGDAYMVVGGVPVATPSHAHRVANFALGMRLAAREVTNPVTGQHIHIRVGLHTGPVLAGVVGDKMPRYCLFGDTVNTASRMESHGVPDHIHISPSTYIELKDQGFDIQARGEIEVKGKGLMTTYFLFGNLLACEDAIMGRDGVESCLYTEDPRLLLPSEPGGEHATTDTSKTSQRPASPASGRSSFDDDATAELPAVPHRAVTPYEWDVTPPYRRHSSDGSSGDIIVNTRFCQLL